MKDNKIKVLIWEFQHLPKGVPQREDIGNKIIKETAQEYFSEKKVNREPRWHSWLSTQLLV